jgi:hypothetical protein
MNFMMYWWGIKYFYVSWLMNYHNMILVLHLNNMEILNFNNYETYGNKGDS